MADNRRLYFFFRDREAGAAANLIAQLGEEAARERLRHNACVQLAHEGITLPEDREPIVILPDEWAGELEAQPGTSASILLNTIRWYFEDRGESCEVEPFAYRGEKRITRQFWIGYHALLPVWVSEKAPQPAQDAAPQPAEAAQAQQKPAPAAAEAPAEAIPAAPMYGSNALEDKREEEGAAGWRDVYIFISSTFNDMHAERDYLVKRVFPELSAWCARHRLRLRDIDLRWGITEEDSQENLRTVEICLENIDRCRPFFLCFVGQRRGWVPTDTDIAQHTFETFPKLRGNLGCSVTEMEVIHALIDPMRRTQLSDADAVARAFFYLRDDSYLSDIRESLRGIYTNSASDDPARDDRLLAQFRERTIPSAARPCRHYTCRWDESGMTPELAAVKGAPADVVRGSLTDFRCDGDPLSDRIIADLKDAIADRYHIADDPDESTPLKEELEEQSLFLYTAGEAFIERPGDLAPFEHYVGADSLCPLILTAPAGMGKSSLIAHWIIRAPYQIYYRFIGRSRDTNSASALVTSIWQQLHEEGKVSDAPPMNSAEALEGFAEMLAAAADAARLVLVLDAVDQLPGGVNDIAFLPRQLPPNVRLIISVKEDAPDAEGYLAQAASYAEIVRVRPLTDEDDRNALVEGYLSNYLKKLSARQQQALVTTRGAENPLYLKIVLSELRIFGAYDALQSHIEEDFGDTPQSAFDAVLSRLERDTSLSALPMRPLIKRVFGWLCHARGGMKPRELARMLVLHGIADDEESALDTIYVLKRQLRAFLTEREMRIDFFYDSFREACCQRYTRGKPSEIWHAELADYFSTLPMTDPRRLSEQAYQYAAAGQKERYLAYVTDYDYLYAKLTAGGVRAAAEDYRLSDVPEAAQMEAFLGLAGTVLATDPDQLAIRLFGHLSGCASERIQKLLKAAERHQQGAWLKPLTPCFEEPRTTADLTMTSREDLSASIALFRNDAFAATTSGREIIIWKLANGAVEQRLPVPKDKYFHQIAATADGHRLIAAAHDSHGASEILVYDAVSLSCTLRFSVDASYVSYEYYGQGFVRYFRFTPTADGRAILIAAEQKLLVYSLTDGSLLSRTQYRRKANLGAVCAAGIAAVANIHPQNSERGYDTQGFYRVANPAHLYLLDSGTGALTPYREPVGDWRANLETAALSPDGSLLAGSDGTRSLILRTDTGEVVKELAYAEVRVMMFLPKRGLFLLGGRTFALYDASDFSLIMEVPGLGYCNSAAVSADERFAVLRLEDRRIRVISLETEAQKDVTYGAPAPIRSVCLSRDGRTVVASCYDNFVDPGMERTTGLNDKPNLYVFDRESGVMRRRLRLSGRYNRDFTYLAPGGSAAVSKNFQEADYFIIRWWSLPEDPIRGDEELYYDPFSVGKRRESLGSSMPDTVQFSSDRQYVVTEVTPNSFSVYRVRTGRLMGTVHPKKPVKGLMRLFRKDDDPNFGMNEARFDVTGDGTILYILFPDHECPRIEQYDIAKDKLIWSRKLIGEHPSHFFHGNFANDLCRVLEGAQKLAFVNGETAAMMDLSGRVLFSVSKGEEGCGGNDFFAACSDDGRYLAISGAPDYRDTNQRLHLYDTQAQRLVAAFVADGFISEIIFEDDRTLLFGMGNGRICRLRLTE